MTVLNCEQAREKLFDFLDRELADEEAALVREHIEMCDPCSQTFASIQEFIVCVKARLRETRLPPELVQRITAALAELDA